MITYLNPAVALLLGIVVLGEQPTVGMLIGFPLVLLGSVLATRGPRRRTAAAPSDAAEPGQEIASNASP